MHTLAGSLCLTFGGLLSLVSNMYFFFPRDFKYTSIHVGTKLHIQKKKKTGGGGAPTAILYYTQNDSMQDSY